MAYYLMQVAYADQSWAAMARNPHRSVEELRLREGAPVIAARAACLGYAVQDNA